MSNLTLPAPKDLLTLTLEHCRERLHQKDFVGAIQTLNRAINLSPDNPDILVQRASLHWHLKNPAAAQADFAAALNLNPELALAHSGLARCHLHQGQLAEAQACAIRALDLDPADPGAASVIHSLPPRSDGAVPTPCPRFRVPAPPASAPMHSKPNPDRRAVWKFLTEGCEFFADVKPPLLTPLHLKNSRVVARRKDILALMPSGGVCAEIGTQTGNFAKQILSVMKPRQLHIYDLDFKAFDHAYFQPALRQGTVEIHVGDSSTQLAKQPDGSFDFIYIDGDHSYPGAVRDLTVAVRKVKAEGWIVCNDYTLYSPLEKSKYGVYRAVNEFCLDQGFEIAYLGLHQWGYHDVALRKMALPDFKASLGERPPRRTRRISGITKSTPALQAPALGAPPPKANCVETVDAADVIQTIGPGDEMFTGDKTHYFGVGKSALRGIESALSAVDKTRASIGSILDLPCGHGRVMRFLKAAFPQAQITACDLNKGAVDFCAKTFGAQPVYSNVVVNQIPLGGKYDLIWSGSLLTHLRPEACADFVGLFNHLINPGGLIVFTLHGRWVERSLATGRYKYGLKDQSVAALLKEYAATGFGYADYPGTSGYGISVSSPAYALSQLVAFPDLKLISYHEKGWDNHQDLVCLQKLAPHEPMS